MQLLKRALPFSLTLVIGITVGALTHLSRIVGNYNVPVIVNTSEQQLGSPHCFSDVERQVIASTGIYGMGSAYHEVIKIAFDRQRSEVEEQNSGRGKIIYYENKQRDAKILYLPPPDYWTGEHDFKHCESAILRATLDSSGEITEIVPISLTESAEHNESVMAAARKIRFDPAVDEYGRKMPQKVAILYRY